jgi:hypothetical protein
MILPIYVLVNNKYDCHNLRNSIRQKIELEYKDPKIEILHWEEGLLW